MTFKYRLIVLIPIYIIAVWVTFYAYMDNNDLPGLVCLLLVIGGILVTIHVVWQDSNNTWTSVLATNFFILTMVGLVVGFFSEQLIRDLSLGVLAGLLASIISYWLLDMAFFRPRLKLFLSYRRGDSAYITGRLRDCLIQRYGAKRVFMDVDSLLPGADFKRELSEFESQCDAVLVVIGNNWLNARDENGNRRIDQTNDYVRLEIETSLKLGIPIIPVLIQGTKFPSANDLPHSIREITYRQAAVIRPDPDFFRDIVSLKSTLDGQQSNSVKRETVGNSEKIWLLNRAWFVTIFLVVFLVPLGWRLLDELTRDVRYFKEAAILGNGKQIISLNGETLRLWNLSTGKTLKKKHVQGLDKITDIEVSQVGNQLLVQKYLDGPELWEIDSLTRIHQFKDYNNHSPWSNFSWSHDDKCFAVQEHDDRITLWSIDEKNIIAVSEPLTEFVKTLDRTTLSCSASEDMVVVHNLTTKEFTLLEKKDSSFISITLQHNNNVLCIKWANNGQRLAIGRSEDPYLLIHDFSDTSDSIMIFPYKKSISSIAWSTVSNKLAAFGRDSVTVWDSESCELQYRWGSDSRYVSDDYSGVWWKDDLVIFRGEMDVFGSRSKLLLWEIEKQAATVIYDPQFKYSIEEILGWSRDSEKLIIHIKSSSRIGSDSKLIFLGRDRNDIELVLRVGVWEGLLQKIVEKIN